MQLQFADVNYADKGLVLSSSYEAMQMARWNYLVLSICQHFRVKSERRNIRKI